MTLLRTSEKKSLASINYNAVCEFTERAALNFTLTSLSSTPVPPEEAPTPTPADREAPTPTPADREAPPSTPGSSRSGRKRWGTPDPDARPFSAQRANGEDENNSSSDTRNQKLRPNSSTGGAEPSKRQRRQLPAIDKDLDSVQRARFASVQFSSVQDGVYALGKAHMHLPLVSQKFPIVAFETVPVFIWLTLALSCSFMEDCQALSLSLSLSLCVFVSLCLCLCLCLSLSVSVSLSLCLSVSLSLSLSLSPLPA